MTDGKQDDGSATRSLRDRLKLSRFLGGGVAVRSPAAGDVAVIDVPRERMPLPVRKPRTRPSMYWISLVGCVLIPAFATVLYLIFIASDQYVAEARFAVRKAPAMQATSDKSSEALAELPGRSGAPQRRLPTRKRTSSPIISEAEPRSRTSRRKSTSWRSSSAPKPISGRA